MSTEESFSEDVASRMLKDLQSWWEIPSMAQYISLFRESFNLPEIEIEELEKGFIDDTIEGPSTWLQNLIIAFLKSIMPGRGVNAENWELHLRKLIKRKWPAEQQNPFVEESTFQQLTLRAKVVIVYSLCLYRLDRNDIVEVMKSMDAEALRVQKLGVDDVGNTYWYFYGTRLYKEEAEEKKAWDEEWKQQKKKSFKKRRRGRPRKRMPTSDGESDFEDFGSSKNDGFMNVNEKSRWSVVCDTIEEWVDFAEKFKNSKSKNETNLFKIIQENFLPTLNKIYEEKEKKLQEKIRELMPVREKIVTRRETRRLRGEDVDRIPVNGYGDDEVYYPVKDRAQRLEERNKRASEAEYVQIIGSKKAKKHDSEHDGGSEYDSSIAERSESDGDDLQSQMEKLLTSVKLHKDAWPFLYPVNEEDAPGYYEIIKDPIDLSMIENRLYEGEYETVGDLDSDFSKMVSNCELYNGEYHAYSKMAQMLRIAFRKGVAKILDSFHPQESKNADSEGSNDSRYHSNSNSSSSHESPAVRPSNVRKKSKERRKKRKRAAGALDLLAQASELAVQNSNSNDMLNVTNMIDELKKSNDFSNLKILPIHSHPPSVIEKLSSNSSVERVEENEINPPYLNQGADTDIQFVRSSPTNSVASTSSEPSGYINNLTHISNFIDKNGMKKLNLLSNNDMTSVLPDGDSSHHDSNTSPVNEPATFLKGPVNSDNLHGFDNILEEYNENFLSHFMKQPACSSDSQMVAQSKDNNSSFGDSLPKQDISFNKNIRKSPPTSNFLGHPVSDNISVMEDNTNMQSDIGTPLNITTVDTSALGISFNSFSKNPANSIASLSQNQANFANNETRVPNLVQEGIPPKNNLIYKPANSIASLAQNQANFADNETRVPNLVQEDMPSKNNHIYKPKPRTPPSESHQYYEPPNMVNCDQALNIPNVSYPSLNFVLPNSSTSVLTAPIQTVSVTSASTMPLQIPAVYPKAVLQKPRMQLQHQQNNSLQIPTTQPNFMFVPNDFNKESAMPYHVYTQNRPNHNEIIEHVNYMPNGPVAAIQMAPNADRRMINNQDKSASRTSPPQKKSPVPQPIEVVSHVPSTNMPYSPASTSTSNISKMSLPVTSSNFTSMNTFTPGTQKEKTVIIRTKAQSKSFSNASTTSFNTVSNTTSSKTVPQSSVYQTPNTKQSPVSLNNMYQSPNTKQNSVPQNSVYQTSNTKQNTVPQNSVYQTQNTKTVPVVFSYNNASPTTQSELRFKNNPAPVTTVQSNMCVPNSMPVVQQVLIPAGTQQFQVQNNGQFVLASPQNTVRLFNKEQNVQMLNNVRQVNQGFAKVVPQFLTTAPVLQVPKDVMSGLQFQAVSQNNTQAFSQVTQSPQFVNIPTYMLTNQNAVNDSSQQSVMNLQPFQISQRQMHINSQGNV